MKRLYLITCILLCFNLYGQGYVDSLRNVANQAQTDTAKAAILYQIAMEVMWTDFDQGLDLAGEIATLATKSDDPKTFGLSNKVLAYHYHYNVHQPKKAVRYYKKAISDFKTVGDKFEVAYLTEYIGHCYYDHEMTREAYDSYAEAAVLYVPANDYISVGNMYNYLATIESDWGDQIAAFANYKKAIRAYEITGGKADIAMVKMNMGSLLLKTGDKEGALEFFEESLELRRGESDAYGMAFTYGNISIVYKNLGDNDKALIYQDSARSIREEIGDVAGMATIYNNYGAIYFGMGELELAEEYWLKAVEYSAQSRNPEDIIIAQINLGQMEELRGNFGKAKSYFTLALEGAIRIEQIEPEITATHELSGVHESLGNYRESLSYFKRYKFLEDSLSNKDKLMEITREATGLKYEDIIRQDSLEHALVEQTQQAEIERAELEEAATARQNQLIILIGIISGISAILIILVLIRNNQRKKRDNQIILEQKNEVESQRNEIYNQKEVLQEKNKEITDSILYAKHLQDAILPPADFIKEVLPESFVLYLPKDIVAGDFYWVERVGDHVFFAVADCTGHGVPGAMVSVVCTNALNKSVGEEGITDPAKILDRVTQLVVERFKKASKDVHDGMDVALCMVNANDLGKDECEVHFSGAFNPLWILRSETKLIESVAASRQSVGISAASTPFISNQVTVKKGDILYMFSDGYADQFGGPKGKKFKSSNFRKLLEQQANQPLESQHSILESTLESWRGELEQIDDVCVMGVRF